MSTERNDNHPVSLSAMPRILEFVTGATGDQHIVTGDEVDRAARKRAEQVFLDEERKAEASDHSEQMHSSIRTITLPYELGLTRLATDIEIKRFAKVPLINPVQTERKRKRKQKKEVENKVEKHTVRSHMEAENGDCYPFQLIYKAQEVNGERCAMPDFYEQLLRKGTRFPDENEDRYGEESDALKLDFKDGFIHTVHLKLPKAVISDDLVRQDKSPSIQRLIETLFTDESRRLDISFSFNYPNEPKVMINHLSWTSFSDLLGYMDRDSHEYTFRPAKNGFQLTKWRERPNNYTDVYKPRSYLALLQEVFNIIPVRE